jgi:hypothetical protein
MTRPWLLGIVLLLLVVLLLLMLAGWRARQKRQASIARPGPVPAHLGTIVGVFDALYVATTVAGEPLNRITVGGLGYRARATITVAHSGIVLALRGTPEVFVPLSTLREVTRATWTIDRVVEHNGLVLLAWTLGTAPTETRVDSYLRLNEPEQLLDAIDSIFPVTTGRTA